jgi:hypothetical protein
VLGGENQQDVLNGFSGYSETAQCTGKRSYLEPISQSLLKSIEGVYALVLFATNGMLKTHVYLDRIRNTMQKPVEGLLAQCYGALNKGAIVKKSHNSCKA